MTALERPDNRATPSRIYGRGQSTHTAVKCTPVMNLTRIDYGILRRFWQLILDLPLSYAGDIKYRGPRHGA